MTHSNFRAVGAFSLLVASLLITACSTPIDIQPPASAPDAPPPPSGSVFETKVTPRQAFVCPTITNTAGADKAGKPQMRSGTDFYAFKNLRFDTLSLVSKGLLSSPAAQGLTSTQLDQLFFAITGSIADEWRQRLAWVSPPGKSGRTLAADLWLADLPPAGSVSSSLPKLSMTLRDNATGELLLVQCNVRMASGANDEILANAIQAWASTLASHMEAASH